MTDRLREIQARGQWCVAWLNRSAVEHPQITAEWRHLAREDVPWLLAELASAHAQTEQLRGALTEVQEFAWERRWNVDQRLKAIDATVERTLAAVSAARDPEGQKA